MGFCLIIYPEPRIGELFLSACHPKCIFIICKTKMSFLHTQHCSHWHYCVCEELSMSRLHWYQSVHPTIDQFIVIHQFECLEMLLFTCTYTMCCKMRYIWQLCRLTVRQVNLYRGSLSVNREYICARTLWVTVRLISLTQGSWLFSLRNKQVVVGISKWSAHSVEDESAEWGVRTLDLLHTAGGSQTFSWGRPSNSFFTFVIGICKDLF